MHSDPTSSSFQVSNNAGRFNILKIEKPEDEKIRENQGQRWIYRRVFNKDFIIKIK